jgi:hypothetical protein
MSKNKRKTAGQQMAEIKDRNQHETIEDILDSVQEYAETEEYPNALEWAALHGKKEVPCIKACEGICDVREKFEGDFYIINLHKAEKIGALRCFFFPKKSCPTPTYNQIVYKYDHQSNQMPMLWCIPDKNTVKMMYEAFIHDKSSIPQEMYRLANHCIKFISGEYDSLAARENNETKREIKIDIKHEQEFNENIARVIEEKANSGQRIKLEE